MKRSLGRWVGIGSLLLVLTLDSMRPDTGRAIHGCAGGHG